MKMSYTIKASDLLQGWTDVEGDALSIKNIETSIGELKNLGDGNWALRTPKNFNGKVELSYSVADFMVLQPRPNTVLRSRLSMMLRN